MRGRPRFANIERLEARELLTVTYQGGAELPNVEAQGVYLGSNWSSSASLQSQSAATDAFLATLVQSPYMDMLTNAGYNVGRGTASAGVVDGLSLSTTTGISDAQIQADLQALITAGKVQAPDANRLYVVYVEPGIAVQDGSASSTTTFLGYHGAFGGRTSSGAAVDIHYAVIPAPGTPNPTSSSQGFTSDFNELTSVTSHELAEAVTDPNVNYKTLGWYDYQLNGEIADLAEGHGSTITGSNGMHYVVQDVVNQNDQVISPSTAQTPPPSNGLSAPTLTVTAASSTVAQLSWTAVTGTQGYRVYEVSGTQSTLLGTLSSSATSAQVTGLTAGSTVSFKVEAYNSTAVADSQIVNVTMPAAPVTTTVSVPQLTVTPASSTSAVLNWGHDPQAQGYRIYWSNGYQDELLGTVNSATTSVTITGLAPGSTGYFLVEAFNATSYANSQWVPVTTPFATAANATGITDGREVGHAGGQASAANAATAPGESTWDRGAEVVW